jgi:hypothetical protein
MECRFEEPAPEETSVFTSFMKAKLPPTL